MAGAEGGPAEAPVGEALADSQLLADSLALELLGLLDAGPAQLSRAWALASERLGDAPAAESLALAEQAVRSLVGRGLVVPAGERRRGREAGRGATDRLEAGLRAVESWAGGQAGSVAIARRV